MHLFLISCNKINNLLLLFCHRKVKLCCIKLKYQNKNPTFNEKNLIPINLFLTLFSLILFIFFLLNLCTSNRIETLGFVLERPVSNSTHLKEVCSQFTKFNLCTFFWVRFLCVSTCRWRTVFPTDARIGEDQNNSPESVWSRWHWAVSRGQEQDRLLQSTSEITAAAIIDHHTVMSHVASPFLCLLGLLDHTNQTPCPCFSFN